MDAHGCSWVLALRSYPPGCMLESLRARFKAHTCLLQPVRAEMVDARAKRKHLIQRIEVGLLAWNERHGC